MKDIIVLKETEILDKRFKIYGSIDNPLFLAQDVAQWIEHSRASEMIKTVDEDEKLMQTILASGQKREMWFLTEDGLYEVLMQSRKPIAKQFKKRIKIILKDIRRFGKYEVPSTFSDALALAAEQQKELEIKNQLIGELKPKADYTDKILKSKSLVTITQIAKDYGMSGQAMNKLLHEYRVQYKQSDQWLLYKQHQGKGYTHSETIIIEDAFNLEKTVMNTKWTQKGRLFLYELLKEKDILPVIERN
ncbi:phage antirepressor KilAC domain-containing protein [Erysipelothrix rhusiopathiae]|nr:phage antirepressor KilAC domain-containing protein [Erysipelothrix rhusiopathiae]MDE8086101.1 phage antirepressor KilAC domain-containing protein [Erysipelothrix rhusiopathiae]MDE8089625.1 phage antirepressor KilAC domain-containing protein [Erysipelothrix rhusiopathiae]MDE8096214.1 phage antirepressor KilAC domain-containing protein [Erysipelothrix rhusiopathiae]MDE8101384.1 phage antirepressor KilAC domain-containing protein [Erysipelothrix rhusiopathiae]